MAGCWPESTLGSLPHGPSNGQFTMCDFFHRSKTGEHHWGATTLTTTPYVLVLVYKISKRAIKIFPFSKYYTEDSHMLNEYSNS